MATGVVPASYINGIQISKLGQDVMEAETDALRITASNDMVQATILSNVGQVLLTR